MQSEATPADVQRTYLTLVLLQTLAASLIWGINTLFLLDAGLSITEAFVANAAFTAGMVLFEVPTGVIADAAGRRASFILGAATLLLTTLAYLALWQWEAGIGWWVVVSALIGLGFTFFSGATEAWLIDALSATGFSGNTESVFGRGQTAAGVATLVGTIAGGFLAQISLGVPYLVRSILLLAVIVAAYLWMRDLGYEPRRGQSVTSEVKSIIRASITHGLGNRPVRLLMFAAPFSAGVGIWVYYAFQPYLLELFGDPNAVYLSGLAAAVFAVAQMVGGTSVAFVRRRVTSRSGVILIRIVLGSIALLGVGAAQWLEIPLGFWLAITLLTVNALAGAIAGPMEQALVNHLIPSQQRATVLSFSSLMGSAGGVVSQPALGRAADVFSLGVAYLISGALLLFQIPFVWAVKKMGLSEDRVHAGGANPSSDLAS